jgi:hypothetical protein
LDESDRNAISDLVKMHEKPNEVSICLSFEGLVIQTLAAVESDSIKDLRIFL